MVVVELSKMMQRVLLPESNLDQRLVIFLKLTSALGGLLLLWRVWRFTILPTFLPDEPKELPYWIPFIGHAKAFFQNSDDLLAYGRNYFRNTREIFSITIAGQQLYIVTSPKDITAVHKDPVNLPFRIFTQDMYRSFGMSPIGVAKMYEPASSKGDRSMTGVTQEWNHIGTALKIEQLHPGPLLETLTATYLAHVERQIAWENIPDDCIVQSLPETKVISLAKWCNKVLGEATMEAFFGESLRGLSPTLLEDFETFDTNSWMMIYRYPRAFAKVMYEAKDRGTDAFTRYFQLPVEKRRDACHCVQALEVKQRELEMNDLDIAVVGQTLFWAANANQSKVCTWLLTHILYDPPLLASIRKEIRPGISNGKIDMQYLLNQCPLLNASWNEVLRLTTAAASARIVQTDTRVGGKLLRANRKVLIPYHQLHHAEEYFGPDVSSFRPSRFLENKNLQSSPFFKPFGGGLSYCSGRFLAKREVLALAAVIVTQYAVELEDKSKPPPQPDTALPTLGVMEPIGGEHVLVRVKPLGK